MPSQRLAVITRIVFGGLWVRDQRRLTRTVLSGGRTRRHWRRG